MSDQRRQPDPEPAEREPVDAYEPPVVEDLDVRAGQAVTAAGAPSGLPAAAPRTL